MTLTAAGNLGIGTTTINVGGWGKALTLQGVSNAAYEVTDGTVRTAMFASAGSIGGLTVETNHPLGLYTNGTERMRIFTDGNILMQTGGTFTNAGYKLDVNGTGRFSGALTGATATFSGQFSIGTTAPSWGCFH